MNIKQFCDTGRSRYTLEEPWRAGDCVIATDGRIMVRVDATLFPEAAPPTGRVPSAGEVLAIHERAEPSGWQAVPDVDTGCKKCGGYAQELAECETCHGEGRHLCECCGGEEHDCGDCDGKGTIKTRKLCETCIVAIGEAKFAAAYIAKIASLPNAKCQEVDGYLLFEFDGGTGVLAKLNI